MGGDSYVFDPTTSVWSRNAGTGPVPGQAGGYSVYDPVRDRFITRGAQPSGIFQVAAGTFEWTLLTAETHGASMNYDAARDRIEAVTTDGVVWAMSMDTPPVWTQISNPNSIPASVPWLGDTPVVHDTNGDRLIVFSGSPRDATWAYSLLTNVWSLLEPGSNVAGVPPGRVPDVLSLASCRLVTADRVSITADVPAAGTLALEVFDVLGRSRGRSQETVGEGGRREFTVSLHGAASAGLYFVRAVQGAQTAEAKLVAIH